MKNKTSSPISEQTIPDKKFVMVIDLVKCVNARKCVERCQDAHHLPPHQELMKVYLMQESEEATPYWMPKPCFHCDNPMCVSTCPVGATIKRTDGIVLINEERCIGCKLCMTVCPYSARQFNRPHHHELHADHSDVHETRIPEVKGTVRKCDFCSEMVLEGKMPHCVTACPMGVIYFGNLLDDLVTNGNETISFSELITTRSGYRHLEDLGTMPSVYYLPPVIVQPQVNQ